MINSETLHHAQFYKDTYIKLAFYISKLYVVDITLKFLNLHISHSSCGIFILGFMRI